ncbi:class I SAM-dependent methyltransferase [Streptomyces sp. NPDC003691]
MLPASPVPAPGTAGPPSPGAVRELLREELLARQLDEQIVARYPVGQRLRILDVGTGRGLQALRLARAGHTVTGLEADPGLLADAREALSAEPAGIQERVRLIEGDGRETGAHFAPGSFDVVLCHGVLMCSTEPDAVLAGLARVLAPGGLLSLVVRNADALAFGPGLAGDWAGALAALEPDAGSFTDERTGRTLRADRLDALSSTLAGIAAPLHVWYGVQVFSEWADDARLPVPPDGARVLPPDLERLLAAEDRAGRTDPYRRTAALLHLCGVRG